MSRISSQVGETKLFVVVDDKVTALSNIEFERTYTHPIIRIHAEEYCNIPSGVTFTHFNLHPCDHQTGQLYYLAKIIGDTSPELGSKPILEMRNVWVAKCISVIPELQYREINLDLFKYSMGSIQSVAELKRAIVSRYARFRQLAETELLEAPVSVTHLELLFKTKS